MKRLIKILALLLLTCSLCERVAAQTAIPVQNASFEQNAPAGSWSSGSIPGWAVMGSAGLLAIPSLLPSTCDGSSTVAWSNGGTISQDLGAPFKANTTYTFKVCIVRRSDGLQSTYSLSLGGCSVSGAMNAVPVGTSTIATLTCPIGATPPSGTLVPAFGCSGTQCDFDSVSLTSVSNSAPLQPIALGLTNTSTLLFDDGTAVYNGAIIPLQFNSVTSTWIQAGSISSDTNGNLTGTFVVDPNLADSNGNVVFQLSLPNITNLGLPVVPLIRFQQGSTGLNVNEVLFKTPFMTKLLAVEKATSIGLIP